MFQYPVSKSKCNWFSCFNMLHSGQLFFRHSFNTTYGHDYVDLNMMGICAAMSTG